MQLVMAILLCWCVCACVCVRVRVHVCVCVSVPSAGTFISPLRSGLLPKLLVRFAVSPSSLHLVLISGITNPTALSPVSCNPPSRYRRLPPAKATNFAGCFNTVYTLNVNECLWKLCPTLERFVIRFVTF